MILTVHFFTGWLQVRRILRRSTLAPQEVWRFKLASLLEKMAMSRPVRLLQSAWVEVPTVIGCLKPVILVPASAFTGLSPDQVELLLAHELAHIRRLLHTNCSAAACPKEQVLAHYKGLLDVEEAFCQLKSFLEVRPVFHRRPDRVRNHVRLCFLAYWLSARLGGEWRLAKEPGEVPRILRRLQTIRIGRLQVGDKPVGSLMTDIPKELNDTLEKLGLLKLFASLPASVL